jgi:hypothetical protein
VITWAKPFDCHWKGIELGGTINLAFYGGCNALYSLPESTKEDFDVLEI